MSENLVVKKHWLYGDCKFKVDVQVEDNCSSCTHWNVCKRDMQNFCRNYNLGTSEDTTCDGCIHRYTRYYVKDEERIPCFKCQFFEEKAKQ